MFFTLFVILGPQAYTGSFDALFGWLPFVPRGLTGALLLTAVLNLASAVFFSAVQIGLYRRALSGWPARAACAGCNRRRPRRPLATITRS